MGTTTSSLKELPGEPLMCVWQAVLVTDLSKESWVKRDTLMEVLKSLNDIDSINYNEIHFGEAFKESKIEFRQFKAYVFNKLRDASVPLPLVTQSIEFHCWNMVSKSYTCEKLSTENIFKMWTIFNRMCKCSSYPARMSKQQVNFLFEKIAENIYKTWNNTKQTIPEVGLTFQETLNLLSDTLIQDCSTALVNQCMEHLHAWLVREVMKTGWLTKRTHQNANWTSWVKRWFVMTPGQMIYYDTEERKVKKGTVVIDEDCIAKDIDSLSLTNNIQYKFKITNKPTLDIELCAETKLDKNCWLALIHENISTLKAGTTPQMKLLKDRALLEREDQKVSLTVVDIKLQQAKTIAEPGSDTLIDDNNSEMQSAKLGTKMNGESSSQNAVDIQKDKIRAVFNTIDKDGNGRIDKGEFAVFINGLGVKLDKRETDLIFDTVDKDQNSYIFFEEFVEYYLSFVMENSKDSATEGKLRAAFLAADRDGSGGVNFSEFSEYVYSQKRNVAIDQLMSSFQSSGMEGDIKFDDFKDLFKNDPTFAEIETGNEKSENIEGLFKQSYVEADVSELTTYLQTRWNKFASFKRYGSTGDLVMKGGEGMVDDIVPGNYSLVDLACFSDLPPIEPKKVVVKGVNWVQSNVPGKSGKVIFPNDFSCIIPSEIATNGHLAYYDCSFADGNQQKVSLFYRHGVQDFTYENNYLEAYVKSEKAGAGMEKHDFAHLDCALEEESGHFLIGKFVGEDLHLTGFKVPTRHTIYVPAGVIHSNDYLKGTWRTMLSDEADIEHVQLVKQNGGQENYQHFTFSFDT